MVTLIAIGLMIATVIFVAYPLFRPKFKGEGLERSSENRQLGALLSKKELAYLAIKELDFDYETGKLSQEDYRQLRDRYKGEAITTLKMIDDLQQKKEKEIEDQIEREILKIREVKMVATTKEEKDKLTCNRCGAEYEEGDRFCSSCGVRLEVGSE